MDDPFRMGRGEAARNLHGDVERRARRQSSPLQALAQRFARDELHDEEVSPPDFFE